MVEWQSRDGLTTALRLLLVLTLIGLVGAALRVADDPSVPLLHDSGQGVWLTADSDVSLSASFEPLTTWQFRRRFTLDEAQPAAQFSLQLLRFAKVRLDERLLLTTTEGTSNWQQIHEISVPKLEAGDHVLLVEVTNRNGPPSLWSDSEQPRLVSGNRWEVSTTGGETWIGTRPARENRWAPLSGMFPTVRQSVQKTAIWSLLIFVATFALTWNQADPLTPNRPASAAGQLRTVLIIATGFLGLHNLRALQPYVGYDVLGHLDYIRFVAEQGSIPLASDGWQMFQSPLYYLINAPLHWGLADRLEPESLVRALRIIPLACGLLQIEITYRLSRVAFPDRSGMQCVATVVGGMMPMSVSMSQSIGNEPLAGLLTALALLRFLTSLKSDESNRREVVLLGIVWGLALLTKVTPVLLGPVFVLGTFLQSLRSGASFRSSLAKVGILLVTAGMVCGWYYLRNGILMGRPFVGGWDPSRGIVWWQYPGYRMTSHLTGFGAALLQPIFSGVYGLWDGLYSTVYADGFLSGIDDYKFRPTWNESFLIAGACWGLLPTVLIAGGTFRGLFLPGRLDSPGRTAVVVAAVGLGIFLSAVLYLYIRIPIYGAAKGSYLLGLLPCLGLLAAAGAEPILRSRTGAAILAGLLACWCTGTLIAFWA